MKKYVAEFIGTLVLVLVGCGTAAVSGGIGSVTGIVGIALAFGLSIVAMAYSIGNISGCHVNPAVSFAMFLTGKLSAKDFGGYVAAQVLGALAGAGILKIFVNCAKPASDAVKQSMSALGTNGYGTNSFVNISATGALLVEIVLTFIFVLAILGVTSTEKFGSCAGIVIGLSLVLVHLIGIPLTGTSVNPARSLGPALFVLGDAIKQVWVFIVGPLVGAAIAAFVWKFLSTDNQ